MVSPADESQYFEALEMEYAQAEAQVEAGLLCRWSVQKDFGGTGRNTS